MKVILKGLNKRGKERVASFGIMGTFALLSEDPPANRAGCILVESLDKRFRLGTTKTTWSGWLKVGEEVDILKRES